MEDYKIKLNVQNFVIEDETKKTNVKIITSKGDKGDTGDTGPEGPAGVAGQDGYTPVKGVDYFTEEDIDDLHIPRKLSELQNDVGYITTETEPLFSNSVAKDITSTDVTNWDNKSDFSGDYNDLTNKPVIPDVSNYVTKDTNELENYTLTSNLSNVATSGNYNDLSNKPTIPDVSNFITKDVNNLTYYTKSSDLSTVATTGDYEDLSNTPSLTGYEVTSNKATSLSSASTDTEYPSAKCVYDYIDGHFPDGMYIMSYGHSTWADFIEAYQKRMVVYCRASSQSNPASGSQTRMAFMAYVNNAENPTEVEFQYYRSVSSHSLTQQSDQVYVYKLNKTNGWSVTVREAFPKIAVGTGLNLTYSNNTLTISLDS